MNDKDIKWSADKKDERDLKRDQKKAMEAIGDLYQRWKVDLCSKPLTRKEVMAALFRLRDIVLDHAKEHSQLNLGEFNEATYKLIDRHITTLISSQIAGHNLIKQHIPIHLVISGQVTEARTEQFRNGAELLAIDFVKYFSEQPGFTGFSWKKVEKPLDIEILLLAHYSTGDSWLVGQLINDEGLDDIPSYDDLEESNTIVIPDFVKLRETGSTAQPGESPRATQANAASDSSTAAGNAGAGNTASPSQPGDATSSGAGAAQ